MWDQSLKKFGNTRHKRRKTLNLKKSLTFFKQLTLKVMKTIRNQVKYPKSLRLPKILLEGH